MAEPLLSMTGIVKSFGAIAALAEASLEVNRGEVHALIGQNGAGKSTMIKILTGYYTKDHGAVRFDGREFLAKSPHDAQAHGISTIYQEINLVLSRSVAENICIGRKFSRYGFLDWPAMRAEAQSLLSRFNIDIDADRPLSDFSTATQQMVAIARAIGFDSKLVIMDEPTSSLDARETATLFDVIRQLKQQGIAIIFVSHKLDELYHVCDRVTIMRDGRTVKAGDMADITKMQLVSAMLGRDISRQDGKQTGFGAKAGALNEQVLFEARGLSDGGPVENVSLRVRQGEISGVAGLLGSGRSETAHLVFGSTQMKSGTMALGGTRYAPTEPGDAIARGVGFLTEDRKREGIAPDMSIAENLLMVIMPDLAKLGIIDQERQRSIVEDFIRKLEIKCTGPDQKVKELSGGNQQKVLLGRWLAMNPKLLILDEPTRGIDVGAKAEIQKLVRGLTAEGLGVIMISSELEEIVEGADRVSVLREGKSVANLESDRITEASVMAAMAEGDEMQNAGAKA